MRVAAAFAAVAILCGGAAAAWPAYTTLRVLTGFVSHVLCTETFVSGFEPSAVYQEALAPVPVIKKLSWVLSYDVNRERGLVTASVAGVATSRAAYRGSEGCSRLGNSTAPSHRVAANQAGTTPLPVAVLTEGQHAAVEAAIDRAFLENRSPPYRNTKAVVVLRDGQLVAERYAPGVTSTSLLLGWSVSKTMVNALLGILSREGILSLESSVQVPEWSSTDARGEITVDQLMRMTSGLALDENHSGRDPSSKILFLSSDVGHDSASAELIAAPGRRWSYSSGGYLILSRIIRDSVGGSGDAVRLFADRELFTPLGMKNVIIETDSMGTPIGSSFVLASARDWARFGALYASDGVVNGRRILPEGWVAKSATPTLNTTYGAGLWTNRGPGRVPHVPAETLTARGLLGQYIVVIPSQRLVVVRFAHSRTPDADIDGVGILTRDIGAALSTAT